MNPYTTQELVKIHQHELIAEADRAHLVREARLASRGTGVPARQPLIWLRDTVSSFAVRRMTRTSAQAGSH